jgi:pimeloyl-ACP methyl ester carboxylesterase
MSTFPDNAAIILVHGAWADGSCWSNVILPLEKEGLKVTCAPIPLTSFANDVAALNRSIRRAVGPVVLVAHAYAGAVIAATTDKQVKALVYVAALAPDEGEAVAQVFYREAQHPQAPRMAADADGLIWIPEGGFQQGVAHKASADQTSIMQAVQRPLSLQCIEEPVPAPLWKSVPCWYLLAEEDRMINPKTQCFMAERMRATVHSHSVDHTPMYTEPALVTQVILEAAGKTLSR